MIKQFLAYQQYYLVGIKGVAMASLAQCLIDAGKHVTGSDVPEAFVTQALLDKHHIQIDEYFTHPLPANTECVVFTSAHQAQQNPQVLEAKQRNIPVFTQAEAIAALFNQKEGIAVCGVGGKSTTSAMITWILEKAKLHPSFSVGVGNIPGLERSGAWSTASKYFVAEADEYVTDPSAPSRGETITPRFSFLHPTYTVCTNLLFDHPDVYKDFNHTQEIYKKFFAQIRPGGSLIYFAESPELRAIAAELPKSTSFGEQEHADWRMVAFQSTEGQTITQFEYPDKNGAKQKAQYTLLLPGKFNALNALAALATTYLLGVDISTATEALATFQSTMRRSQWIGEKDGVRRYDDYAHHPNEVRNIIHAFREWFPKRRLVVAFQSHTYSRTKALFSEFVESFAEASDVVMIDIFASARESIDPTITSDVLCSAIHDRFPLIPAHNLHTLSQLAYYCTTQLHPGDIFLTVGAGDIYKVYELW